MIFNCSYYGGITFSNCVTWLSTAQLTLVSSGAWHDMHIYMLQGSVAILKFIKRIQIHLGRRQIHQQKSTGNKLTSNHQKHFFKSHLLLVCAIQYSTILVTACLTFSGLLHIIACGHYSYKLLQL